MKDRLRRRRRSLVMPARYRRKPRFYATDGRIGILTPSGEWIDLGAVTQWDRA